jgi:selT/selW/selH-like putative selenoprotein
MSKTIEIEFCGENGLGGSALTLKNKILEAFPGVAIERNEASSSTNRIEVYCVGGNRQLVWSNGKADTDKSHATIISNIKSVLG